GEPLRDEEKIFLASVMERFEPRVPTGGYGRRAMRDGWYYDLFSEAEDSTLGAKLVADYFVSSNAGAVDYAGVASVRMGVFVVDAGGSPRVMVGPVARAFSARGAVSPRFTDDDVGRFPIQDPWAASYTAPAARAPR